MACKSKSKTSTCQASKVNTPPINTTTTQMSNAQGGQNWTVDANIVRGRDKSSIRVKCITRKYSHSLMGKASMYQ